MDYTNLYDQQDRFVLKTAKDSLKPGINRVQEIIKYAKQAGYKKIGIANCTTFNKEADELQRILENEGFLVSIVNCKYGNIKFNDLVSGYKGISCNPAGQAKYLEENNTELNIMIGLCLGHDMIFNSKSKAAVTTLVVKDRKLKHNPLEAIKV